MLILLAKAAFLGLVEGVTEFLPISSTGHLILASSLVGFVGEKSKVFAVVIQGGAMIAILVEYRARLIQAVSRATHDPGARRFISNLVIAFIPAAVLGLVAGKWIKRYLFAPVPVAIAFIVGAFVIFLVERRKAEPRVTLVDGMTPLDALKVGLAQCFALVPGTSRSAATIVGGLLTGLSRSTATEFSFFLAVPTLFTASLYDLAKHRELLSTDDVPLFVVGFVTAGISAYFCVRWLLRYVATHDLKLFAWYRIAFGVAVLVTDYFSVVTWSEA